MKARQWILVLEPDTEVRQMIVDESRWCAKLNAVVVSVASADEFAPAIAKMKSLPVMLIAEWFPGDVSITPSLKTLASHGILERIFLVAIAGAHGRQALSEAQSLGAKRFVSKFPDETAFRGKIADVLRECAALNAGSLERAA